MCLIANIPLIYGQAYFFKKNPQSKILPRTKIDFQGLVGNALLPTFPSVLYRIHGCFPPNISLSLFLLLSPLLLWKQPQPLDARREWSQELPAVLQTEPASSVRWLLCGWFGRRGGGRRREWRLPPFSLSPFSGPFSKLFKAFPL